jgi:glucokinase
MQERAWGAVVPRPKLVLAADVGGTHARIGLVDAAAPAGAGGVLAYERYAGADWPGLAEILADFLARHPGHAVDEAAIAVAGYVRDGELVAENLRWPVRLAELRERLRLRRLQVVNDFEALAFATQYLGAEDSLAVIDAPAAAGPVAVVGPGTGLGCALLVPDGNGVTVLPSEGGHVALAPGSEREMALLQLLSRGRDYVHTGHVLSGPGLVNLYRAIGELDGLSAVHAQPEQISAAALDGGDALALDTLHTFCAMLGGFVGDLAVLFKASGGVFLAGGILPQLREFLPYSAFRERFFNKGVMRDFLAGVPVRLIEHGRLGVLGAAGLAARAEV